MKGLRIMLPLALALAATPASAQDNVTQQVRGFADATAGQNAGGDKVLIFSARGGELMVSGMMLAPPDGWPQVPAGSAAILRTRATPARNPDMPAPADFDFVRRTGARLFVAGEWAEPAILWEIATHPQHGVHFRSIDADGAPGAWAVPVNVPASD